MTKFQFTKQGKGTPEDFVEYNIVDTKQILKDLIGKDFSTINRVYELIKSEMQSVIIDLEVARDDGTFPTTILGNVEQKSIAKAENGLKIIENADVENLNLAKINEYFDSLNNAPRISREMYYYVVKHGNYEDETFKVFFDETERTSGIQKSRIIDEMRILARKKLAFEIDFEDHEPRLVLMLDEEIDMLLLYSKEHMDLYKLLVHLDFTLLDN